MKESKQTHAQMSFDFSGEHAQTNGETLSENSVPNATNPQAPKEKGKNARGANLNFNKSEKAGIDIRENSEINSTPLEPDGAQGSQGVPVFSTITPLQNFPMQALPNALSDLAKGLAETFRVSASSLAVMLLGILAGVFQSRCSIVTLPGWRESVSLYIMIVFSPGIRTDMLKSILMRPIETYQAELRADRKQAMIQLDAEVEKLRIKRRKAAELNAQGGPDQETHRHHHEDLLRQLECLSQRRNQLEQPGHLYSDVASALTQNTETDSGHAIVVDFEGVAPLGSPRSISKYLAPLSRAYSGFAVPLSAQEDEADSGPPFKMTCLLGGNLGFCFDLLKPESALSDLGIKYLYQICDRIEGEGPSTKVESLKTCMLAYEQTVLEWLRDDDIIELRLSDEAALALHSFQAEVSACLPGKSKGIAQWMSNLPMFAQRIAGLLHVAASLNNNTYISGETMNQAIEVSKYLLGQVIAINGKGIQEKRLSDADYLIMRLVKKDRVGLTVRELHAEVKSRLKTVKELRAALDVLANRGIIKQIVKVKTKGQETEPIIICEEELHRASLVLANEL